MSTNTSPIQTLLLLAAGAVVALGGVAAVNFVTAPKTNAPTATAISPFPAASQEKAVAMVNGIKITEADLAVAQRDLADELSAGSATSRQTLIDAVVNLTLVAQAADAGKLSDGADFRARMNLLRQRVLRSEYIKANVNAAATDQAIKKRYDDEVAKLDPPEEVKAAHILLDTEEEANAIIEQLKKGGDFAALAKENSKDTGSAIEGGDLGYFSRGQMVKAFEDAAFALAPGQVTPTPVKSEFGFHIIKVEEKRKQPPPPFEEVKEEVQQMVMTDLYQDAIKRLRAAAKIEITDTAAAPGK